MLSDLDTLSDSGTSVDTTSFDVARRPTVARKHPHSSFLLIVTATFPPIQHTSYLRTRTQWRRPRQSQRLVYMATCHRGPFLPPLEDTSQKHYSLWHDASANTLPNKRLLLRSKSFTFLRFHTPRRVSSEQVRSKSLGFGELLARTRLPARQGNDKFARWRR